MDTTVILAQPRVPQLRADVVYVANRGHPRASAGEWEIDVFLLPVSRGDPLLESKAVTNPMRNRCEKVT